MKEKVVLAYSGGLDTTALIPWLKETFDYDVVCCCVNCGQGNELDGLDERAKLSGASKLYIEDIVDEFCDDFIVPCVQAGAVYEHKYLLGTSMARPAIAKKLVEIARKEGAVAICHGATGKGNDQIRFELGIKALAPDIKIIAPWRMTEVTMTFEQGVPKTLNGKEMKVSEIITELNKLGGENGIGIVDIVENRVVGMKSRGVYETPGGTILMAAHEQLEELTLDRETMETKKKLGSQFAQVVYEGKWYTPLREAIQAFVESTQKYVTGEVKFKLYKGNIIKAGTTSPYSLYNESLASFTTGDLYDHHDADGFITLFGLPLKVRAMMLKEVEQNKK